MREEIILVIQFMSSLLITLIRSCVGVHQLIFLNLRVIAVINNNSNNVLIWDHFPFVEVVRIQQMVSFTGAIRIGCLIHVLF